MIQQAEGLMDGAVYPHLPMKEAFRTRYLKAYNNEQHLSAAVKSYDFALLTGNVARANSLQPNADELLRAFASHSQQTGVVGEYSYEEVPEQGKAYLFPVVVKVVQGSKIKQLAGRY